VGRGERGAAAVELALVLFPLFMLMLGIVEFSRVYSLQLRLQHAARETARDVALHYDDPGIDLTALTTIADNQLDSLLGAPLAASLDVKSIVMCTTSTDDAIVTLGKNEQLALPLPDGTTLGAVDVAARVEMPCEG
jgi:Flp pilus assembly protein TadG